MCLAYRGQSRVPASEIDRNELFEAGLGEKEIEFENLNCSPSEFPSYVRLEATSF